MDASQRDEMDALREAQIIIFIITNIIQYCNRLFNSHDLGYKYL